MKLASYTTLSAAAAVLLQWGTFVHANPMFEEHNNAASTEDNCQGELYVPCWLISDYGFTHWLFQTHPGFRVTFPAGTGNLKLGSCLSFSLSLCLFIRHFHANL